MTLAELKKRVLAELGPEDIDGDYVDTAVYIRVTDASKKIMDEYKKDHWDVPVFRDDDGKRWYEVPFAKPMCVSFENTDWRA